MCILKIRISRILRVLNLQFYICLSKNNLPIHFCVRILLAGTNEHFRCESWSPGPCSLKTHGKEIVLVPVDIAPVGEDRLRQKTV